MKTEKFMELFADMPFFIIDEFLTQQMEIPVLKGEIKEVNDFKNLYQYYIKNNFKDIIERKKIINKSVKIDLKLFSNNINLLTELIKTGFIQTIPNYILLHKLEKQEEISEYNKKEGIDYHVVKIPKNIPQLPRSEINKITQTVIEEHLFYFSRFYNDIFIKKEQADLIYTKWIENSFTGYADKQYVIYQNEEIIGFATLLRKKNKEIGTFYWLDLISKLKKEAKRVGSLLLNAIKEDLIEEDINFLYTGTQVYNINAINFYMTQKFKIKNTIINLTKLI